ncbi:12361_t:CDS:2, partial [Funneliformis mosseae]
SHKRNDIKNSNIPFNTVDAIHSLIVRIDDIDNKLVLLSDEIRTIKNEISDDDDNELIMDIVNEQTQHTLKSTLTYDKQPSIADSPKTDKDTNFNNNRTQQNDGIVTPCITQVKSEL